MTSAKMKTSQAYMLALVQSVDKLYGLSGKGSNYNYWKNIFSKMDLKAFTAWMKSVRAGEYCLYVYAPATKGPPQKKVLDLCAKHGVEIMQHLELYDDTTGVTYVTPEKYPVVRAMYRRLEQYALKKLAMPKSDRKVDMLTGQVAFDDRSAGTTHPELTSLLFKNVPTALSEITTRGGNVAAYQGEFKSAIEQTGSVNVGELSKNTVNRTVKTTEVFLHAMGLEVDGLINEGATDE